MSDRPESPPATPSSGNAGTRPSSPEAAGGRLAGRIALITGASRGIGRAVALRYAAEGAHLVLIARTVGALEEVDDAVRAAGGEAATLVPLDLRDGTALDRLGAALYERWGRLDVLVGNAGVLGPLSPVGHIKPEAWDEAFAINVTANYRLLRSLDPLLRRSEAGRAIFVTSGAARKAGAYWSLYAATKAALEALVRSYAAEVETFGVKANLVSPGPIRTAMRAKAFPGEDPTELRPPEAIVETFVDLALPTCARTGEVVELRP